MNYECKCGSMDMFTEKKGNNTGLYCSMCGKFQKWLGRDELRAFEHNNITKKPNKINNIIKNNLNEFIDFLDKNIQDMSKIQPNSSEEYNYFNGYINAYENVKERLINIVNERRHNEYD